MPGWSSRELLDKALKRRAELQLEADALDSLIRTYRALLQVPEIELPSVPTQPDLYSPPTMRHSQAARVAHMLETAKRVIIMEMRPMRRGEIVQRLIAQGVEVVGSDKNKVFGTNLWRSGQFVMIEGRGYWPIDVELPSEHRHTGSN